MRGCSNHGTILIIWFVSAVRNRDMSWPEEMNSLVATKNFRERSNTGMNFLCVHKLFLCLFAFQRYWFCILSAFNRPLF